MTTIVLLMAGMGKRMMESKNKMLLNINGRPLFLYTLDKFKDFGCKILLVVSKDDYPFFESMNLGYELVIGGSTRQESVYNALQNVKTDRVLIHDGARPLISKNIIRECIDNNFDAYFVATKLTDTIRYNKECEFKDLDREKLLDVQTPQGGKTSVFREASQYVKENNIEVTDDISMLVDKKNVNVILGDERNIKVTRPIDLKIMKLFLEEEND